MGKICETHIKKENIIYSNIVIGFLQNQEITRILNALLLTFVSPSTIASGHQRQH